MRVLERDGDPAALRDVDLVLVAVKTYETERALAPLRGLLAAGVAVASLQNGLRQVEQLLAALGSGTTILLAAIVRVEERDPLEEIGWLEILQQRALCETRVPACLVRASSEPILAQIEAVGVGQRAGVLDPGHLPLHFVSLQAALLA